MSRHRVHVHAAVPTADQTVARIKRTLLRVLKREQTGEAELTVVVADHRTVRDLNRRFLGHDRDTDVIAFPLTGADDVRLEGEIYLDLETARERCVEFDATLEDEIVRYAVHGTLHLVGYADKDEAGRAQMRSLEDTYLNGGARPTP